MSSYYHSTPQDNSGSNASSRRSSLGNENIWEDEDELATDRTLAEKEWARLNENFGNSGYLEGIEEGKDDTLQRGFNQGWTEGVQYGFELGRLRGLISPLIEYFETSTAIKSTTIDMPKWITQAKILAKELQDLDIAAVFDKSFFENKSEQSSPLPSLSHEQTDHSSHRHSHVSKETTSGSSCCGGNTNATKQGQQSELHSPTSATKSEMESSDAGGCCGRKPNGSGCCKASEEPKSSTSSSSVSKPDQLIADLTSQVQSLLKQVDFEHILSATSTTSG